MSGPLLRFLIKRHRISIAVCWFVPVLIGVVIGFIYPTYSRERALMEMFRFTTQFFGQGQMDLFSPEGAFTLPFQHPTVLVVFAVVMAIPAMAMPAGERGRGALDLLLATPLSRNRLVLTVAGLQAVVAPMMAFASLVGAVAGAQVAGEREIVWGPFFVVVLNAAALLWLFGAIALLISVAARERSAATLAYGVTVFGFFIIDVSARLWRDGAFLGRFSPYGYLRPASTVADRLGPGLIDTAILFVAAVIVYGVAVQTMARRRTA